MSTKFLLRRGLSIDVPTLDVGELSWDIDTATLRVGDGSSNPPRVYTNKTSNLANLLPAVNWREVLQTPTTLAGYGITDAQPYSHTLAKIASVNTNNVEGVLELDINGDWNVVQIGNIESLTGILAIDQGGTGASNGPQALVNLGAASLFQNLFNGIQTVIADSPQSLTLSSSLNTAGISPGLSLDRHATVPNHTDFAQIRFTTLDTSTAVQEAFKIVVSVADHSYNAFSSYATFFAGTANGPIKVLGIYNTGITTGTGNTPQGFGTINAHDFLIDGISISEMFASVNATFNINNIIGLPPLLSGLLPTTGGTLTGPLLLYGDPTHNNEAATKFYVDSKVGIFTATPPVGDTPPPNPISNQLWWSTLDGNLYIYFQNQWVSAFAIPSLFLGAATDNVPPLQTYVTTTSNPVPASLDPAGVWDSGLILGNGYSQISISVMLTTTGAMSVQRYIDQAGLVVQGSATSIDLTPLQTSVLNIGDGIPWGSMRIVITNLTEDVAGLANLNILLNV